MKETVVGLLLLPFLSVINPRELSLSDLPDDVIEHLKNFGLLNSLNIDQNSVEIVPAISRQSYGPQTSKTEQPPTTITNTIEGSTLPPNNLDISTPVPYVEEVTIRPHVESHKNSHRELVLNEERPTQYPDTILSPERPVYIRVIQPLHVPVPQPYPVYVRVPEGYPVGIHNSLGVETRSSGPLAFQIAPEQKLNGLLNSYVASRVGGVYGNSFNPYQTIDYQRTWQ